MEELSIKVNIADRTYPLRVKPEEEEAVRKAARYIHDKIKSVQQQFAVKDKQDLLSMVLLEAVTEMLSKGEVHDAERKAFAEQLQDIRQLLHHIQV